VGTFLTNSVYRPARSADGEGQAQITISYFNTNF